MCAVLLDWNEQAFLSLSLSRKSKKQQVENGYKKTGGTKPFFPLRFSLLTLDLV